MTVKEFFAKIFSILAGLLWLATFCAGVWQIWFTLSTGTWEWLTITSIFPSLALGFQSSASYLALIFTIISKLSLILVAGLSATFTSFIANKLD